MSDLAEQLRDHFDTVGPPIDVEELVADLDRRAATRGRRRRTAVLAAGLVATVVTAGFAFAALDSLAPERAPVIGEVLPAVPEPDSPGATLPVGRDLVWERVRFDPLPLTPEILHSDGPTVYATRGDDTWWASEDGREWRSLPVHAPEPHAPGEAGYARSSAWRERFVFVSEVETLPEDEDAAVRVVVAKPDGTIARTLRRPEAPAFRTLYPTAVAQGPAGTIVVAEGDTAEQENELTGWVSTDHETWTQIPDTGPFTAQGPGVGRHQFVVVDDGFVALDDSGAIWSSSDALEWARIHLDDTLAAAGGVDEIVWLLPWRGDAVAIGPAGIWLIDDDGVSSLPVAQRAPTPVAGWGNIGVAAGDAGLAWTVADDAVAYSPDGIAWTVQQLPEEMGQVYAFAGPSILVGAEGLLLQTEQGTWVGH